MGMLYIDIPWLFCVLAHQVFSCRPLLLHTRQAQRLCIVSTVGAITALNRSPMRPAATVSAVSARDNGVA